MLDWYQEVFAWIYFIETILWSAMTSCAFMRIIKVFDVRGSPGGTVKSENRADY